MSKTCIAFSALFFLTAHLRAISVEVVRADLTNSLSTEVRAYCDPPGFKHQVFIQLRYETNSDGLLLQFSKRVPAWSPLKGYSPRASLFLPTNSICGSLLLHDETGTVLESRKPGMVLPAAFPVSMELHKLVRKNNNGIRQVEPLTEALDFWPKGVARLKPFYCEDYFSMTEEGVYWLTICPKIYRRSATNDNIIERIDLPPVSIAITNALRK